MLKYEEIAKTIRQRIKSGQYPTHTLLPTQVDFAQEFQVSRMTIKKAFTLLTMEGLVSSQRGAGTRVLEQTLWPKDPSPVTEYDGLTAYIEPKQQTLTSQIIHFSVEFPTVEVQKRLLLTAEQPVYNIIRLRLLEHQPYILEHTYMPVDLVPNLTREVLHGSIYTYLKKHLKLTFAGAMRTIQADKSQAYDQQYLDCQVTDPVLEVEQIVYLKNGRPVEYSRSRNRFDQKSYFVRDMPNN